MERDLWYKAKINCPSDIAFVLSDGHLGGKNPQKMAKNP